MAASSNYKTYARQPRMLTEESGFAGGMLWTENNIDATHLKNIVNFDYDDTTAFLKTRDPFVSEQIKLYDGTEARVRDNTKLLGVYNISAQNEDTLYPAGYLYVFNIVNTDSTQQVALNNDAYVIYRDVDGTYFNVMVEQSDSPYAAWSSSMRLKFIVHDNILYITNNEDTVLYAYTLYCTVSEDGSYDNPADRSYMIRLNPNTLTGDTSNTLSESLANGFNAARGKDMFKFDIQTEEEPAHSLFEGVLLKDHSGNVLVDPTLNDTVVLDIIITGLKKDTVPYVGVFEQITPESDSLDATWKYLGDAVYKDGRLTYEYKFTRKNTILGYAWRPEEKLDNAAEPKLYADDAVASPWIVTYTHRSTSKNSKVKTYNLPTAQASCLWNDRMVLWDLVDNKYTLFISQVDNFFYYPVPNNLATFETEIINCIPYLGDLLVFTADRIYKLAVDNTGVFTQTVIQNDMPTLRQDASCICAIKNMVLFKSGEYYYMVVPKAQSLTGELTIAPVYKNIAMLLNNKANYIYHTLSALYPNHYTLSDIKVSDVPTNIYTEQDTVHILYDVVAPCEYVEDSIIKQTVQQFKLFLNYNTNLRAWTVYIEDTTDLSLTPAILTVSRNTVFVRIGTDNTLYTTTATPSTNLSDAFRCLLDTGYRSISGAIKKRFREVQLKLYSGTENITSFNSAFYLDGKTRRCYNKLEEAFTDDTLNYVTLAPAFDPNTFLLEDTLTINEFGELVSDVNKKGSDAIELSNWCLDFSHFKKDTIETVRIPVSGKGYYPRFILMTDKAIALYINEINWVYRTLYGR